MIILHVGLASLPVDTAVGGAVERRIRILAAAQASLGHQVFVVNPVGRHVRGVNRLDWKPAGVEVVEARINFGGYLGQLLLTYRARAIGRERSVDVIHVHNAVSGGWWARLRRTPSMCLSVDYASPRFAKGVLSLFWAFQMKGYGIVLPVSLDADRVVQETWPGIRTSILHNPVDGSEFCPGQVSAKWRTAARVVGYLGRVNEQKGADLLADAWPMVLDRYRNDVRLVVAGPVNQFGDESGDSACARSLRQAGADLVGALHDDEVVPYLRSIDCLVVPTRRDERFGMVAAEAMACGTPVVTSGVGGLPEVVAESGGINAAPTAEAIAEALISMLRSLDDGGTEWDPRASASRFLGETVAAQSIEIYKEILSGEKTLRGRG